MLDTRNRNKDEAEQISLIACPQINAQLKDLMDQDSSPPQTMPFMVVTTDMASLTALLNFCKLRCISPGDLFHCIFFISCMPSSIFLHADFFQ